MQHARCAGLCRPNLPVARRRATGCLGRARNGAKRKGAAVLHFDGGKLAAAEARLSELRHQEAAQALSAAFGAAKIETEKLRAGMGGAFENAIYLWRQAGSTLRLEQFFRSITTSSLILTAQAHLGKLVIPKPTDARTGIKDL